MRAITLGAQRIFAGMRAATASRIKARRPSSPEITNSKSRRIMLAFLRANVRKYGKT
jgi:hypothetical protein